MIRFYGVMVSTQDSEFCDQSSNLSRTYSKFFLFFFSFNSYWQHPDTGLVESFPMLSGPVAQRIRHLTTNQGIAGSSPTRVNCLFCPQIITSFWLGMFWGFVTFLNISRVKIKKIAMRPWVGSNHQPFGWQPNPLANCTTEAVQASCQFGQICSIFGDGQCRLSSFPGDVYIALLPPFTF